MSSGPAVRLGEGAPPGGVRAGRGSTCGRPVRAGRRDVGGVRHATCPAARRWPASSSTASGSSSSEFGVDDPRGVAAGLVRLLRGAAAARPARRRRAGSSPRRSPGTRPTASRTTRSGGRASTAPGCSPTSRRSTPTTPSCPARELAHAVRNFPDKGAATRSLVPFGYGDGGGGPTREMLARARAHRRPGGLAAGRDRAAGRRSSPPPRPSTRDARRCGSASCTWSCTAARTPPRRRPSRATGAASTCCARPSCGAATAAVRRGARRTRTTSWTGSGRPCCCTSSTTSCPARRSPGCTARRGRPTRAVAAELEALIDRGAAARWPATGEHARCVFNAGAARPRRRARARRGAGPRPARAVRCGAPTAGTCSTTASLRARASTSAGCSPRCCDLVAGREVLAPGRAGNLLQLHPDLPEPVGRLGRRPPTTATGHRPDRRRSEDRRRRTPRGVRVDPRVRRVHGRADDPAAPAAAASTSRPRSTGTSARSSSRSPSRSTCTPTGPRPRSSSGTSTGRRTPTPAGTPPGSRCAPTAGCTSASRATASRCVNDATYGHDVARATRPGGGTTTTVRLSLLRAPRFPDPETDQGAAPVPLRAGARRRRSPTRSGGLRAQPAAAGRRRRHAPVRAAGDASTATAVVVEAVKLADDRSGDVVVRLYESLGGRATAPARARLPGRRGHR